jgi:hypothetical protein
MTVNAMRRGMNKPQRIRIPFTCPRCGEQGAIRVQKLDRSIRCKVCDATFHLNRRFEVVVGSPTVEAPFVALRPAADFRGGLLPVWVRQLQREATPLRATVAAFAAVTVAAIAYFTFFRAPHDELPTTLSGRLKLFVENWVENDIHEIRRLTDPNLTGSVDAWWKLSKRNLAGVSRLDGLEYDVLFENRREGMATTMISKPGGDRNAGLVLFWKLQNDDTWRFDPERSANETGRRDSN